jgi:hypothetical protein
MSNASSAAEAGTAAYKIFGWRYCAEPGDQHAGQEEDGHMNALFEPEAPEQTAARKPLYSP